jgi:hypothetical protein
MFETMPSEGRYNLIHGFKEERRERGKGMKGIKERMKEGEE